MDDIRVTIEKILFDPNVGASVMLLQEEEGGRQLPVWIGPAEALSIAMALEKVKLARPMTHDLMLSVLQNLGVSIDWVRIRDFDDGTFFATLRLNVSGEARNIDSRPSDAIAMAIRMEAPIYVNEQVFLDTVEIGQKTLESIEYFDENLLEDLPTDVFGKYKM